MTDTLAIITVAYENYQVFGDFFKSLNGQKNKNFHLFVSDASANKKKIEQQKFPMTVTEEENKGYAYGINQGIMKALELGFRRFCVINNDTFFKPDFVSSVIKSLNNHPGSIIGGKLYYAPGYEYHKDRYVKNDLGKVIWYAGGSVDWNHALTLHRGVDEVDRGQYNHFEETEFITGALLCFGESVYKTVGPWDESYFLYFEDSDFCIRSQKNGIKLYYDPSIILWHKVSQSTEGSGSKLHQKYQERNRLRFGLKYAPIRTKLHLLKNYFTHSI